MVKLPEDTSNVFVAPTVISLVAIVTPSIVPPLISIVVIAPVLAIPFKVISFVIFPPLIVKSPAIVTLRLELISIAGDAPNEPEPCSITNLSPSPSSTPTDHNVFPLNWYSTRESPSVAVLFIFRFVPFAFEPANVKPVSAT